MADSNERHPYGTCEGCGADIHHFGGRPGDFYCGSCKKAKRIEREGQEQMDRERQSEDAFSEK